MKFYPYERGGGGAEQVLAMLKGGGGVKSFHYSKGGSFPIHNDQSLSSP